MHIRKNRSWELPDSAVTDESHYLRRREFLRTFGFGLAATAILPATMRAASSGFPDSLNSAYKLDGVKLTPYDSVTTYNNFYEWGLAKDQPSKLANNGWQTEPWTIEIGGLCDKPAKFEVNDLIKAIGGIEQRNYRHRCVEAWSMVIPWDGFPLAKLVALAQPKAEAKFVQFTTFFDPKVCAGQRVERFHLAIHRRSDNRGSDERTRVPRDRHLRQTAQEPERRADSFGRAVEVRIQRCEVARENRFRCGTTKDALESNGAG